MNKQKIKKHHEILFLHHKCPHILQCLYWLPTCYQELDRKTLHHAIKN